MQGNVFFCIHMLRVVGYDAEHLPNNQISDDHYPLEIRRGAWPCSHEHTAPNTDTTDTTDTTETDPTDPRAAPEQTDRPPGPVVAMVVFHPFPPY